MQQGDSAVSTLIKNARLFGGRQLLDIRIEGAVVSGFRPGLASRPGESLIDADGGLLIPGLHDHHIHMMSLAASLESLVCGPPAILSGEELASLLRDRNATTRPGWIRGIGYHPGIAGDIDRDWLDRHIPDRPIRIQHRGGRLWVLNSRALQALHIAPGETPPGLECIDGRPTGRLFEADAWLRSRLNRQPPDLARTSRLLASYGITGITDTTPTNGVDEWTFFHDSQVRGELLQRVRMMGSAQLQTCRETELLKRGELKVHLLESCLPELDALCRDIETAHDSGRCVAIHCVTLTELVFALHALNEAGSSPGDRIEHASVCPPDQLRAIREMGLRVVTQPHFIAERGDEYLADVDEFDQPWLYRAAQILAAGVPVAGGSDAPFGSADPWRALRAAVERRTRSGHLMGREEALTPEQALLLFLSPPENPGNGTAVLVPGVRADLCLLDSPWETVREALDSGHVRCTWRSGELIYGSG